MYTKQNQEHDAPMTVITMLLQICISLRNSKIITILKPYNSSLHIEGFCCFFKWRKAWTGVIVVGGVGEGKGRGGGLGIQCRSKATRTKINSP